MTHLETIDGEPVGPSGGSVETAIARLLFVILAHTAGDVSDEDLKASQRALYDAMRAGGVHMAVVNGALAELRPGPLRFRFREGKTYADLPATYLEAYGGAENIEAREDGSSSSPLYRIGIDWYAKDAIAATETIELHATQILALYDEGSRDSLMEKVTYDRAEDFKIGRVDEK